MESNITGNNTKAAVNDEHIHDIGDAIYIVGFLMFLFIFLGVCGNILTIVSLIKCPKIRTNTSNFIINLCIADTSMCLISFPFTASIFLYGDWVHGDILCVIEPFIRYSNMVVSLTSIVAISISRFILISYPGIYKRVYKKINVTLMIASCWIFSFVILAPTLTGVWGRFGYDPVIKCCSVIPVDGKSPKTFLFVAAYVFPSLVILNCYAGNRLTSFLKFHIYIFNFVLIIIYHFIIL